MIRILPVKAVVWAVTLGAAMTVATCPATAAPLSTYLALGDSMAFGETDFSKDPSNGNRGYVKPFADNFLAAQNGGVAPKVINLGVDAETSSTFLNGGTAGDGHTPGIPGYSLNTNYPDTTTSQNGLMLKTIFDQQAKGHSIDTVSVQVGANDLFTVLATPGFNALSLPEQQAKVMAALGTIQTNYTTLLTELHSLLPHANLLLMGYHDPYAADPNAPIEKLAGPAIQALNNLISGEAKAFGAKYVDTYDAIKGNELQDTLIATGNVHPNKKGYDAIVTSMEAAAVPEPSTFLMAGVGLAGWMVLNRRRARRQAA